jgi:hypothetical protein
MLCKHDANGSSPFTSNNAAKHFAYMGSFSFTRCYENAYTRHHVYVRVCHGIAVIAQLVERVHGKDEVSGSNPADGRDHIMLIIMLISAFLKLIIGLKGFLNECPISLQWSQM